MYFMNGTGFWPPQDNYKPFRTKPPKVVLGHTLYVYDTFDPTFNQSGTR